MFDAVTYALSRKYVDETLKGAGAIKGKDGKAATIEIGTVSMGEQAEVTNSGTSSEAIFNFVLPKGDDGDPATISTGDIIVETLSPDEEAYVTVENVGTETDVVLNFTFGIPKGEDGGGGSNLSYDANSQGLVEL